MTRMRQSATEVCILMVWCGVVWVLHGCVTYLTQHVDAETKDIKRARDLMQAARQTKCMFAHIRGVGRARVRGRAGGEVPLEEGTMSVSEEDR